MNGGQKKPAKKNPVGEKCAENLGRNQGFTKREIRTADPTRLNAWYLKKKELSKEKLNERENAVGSEA